MLFLSFSYEGGQLGKQELEEKSRVFAHNAMIFQMADGIRKLVLYDFNLFLYRFIIALILFCVEKDLSEPQTSTKNLYFFHFFAKYLIQYEKENGKRKTFGKKLNVDSINSILWKLRTAGNVEIDNVNSADTRTFSH